jgi:hypothetical protein
MPGRGRLGTLALALVKGAIGNDMPMHDASPRLQRLRVRPVGNTP